MLGCSGDLLSKYISVSETQTPVPGAGIRCTWVSGVHSAIVFQLIIYLQKHFFIARKLHFSSKTFFDLAQCPQNRWPL